MFCWRQSFRRSKLCLRKRHTPALVLTLLCLPAVVTLFGDVLFSISSKPTLDPGQVGSMYTSHFPIANDARCPLYGRGVQLVIIIESGPVYNKARDSIRRTWATIALREGILYAFILGTTTNRTLQRQIEEESRTYGDIIQGDFVDSYHNLTLKTVAMVDWVNTFCPHAKYVLKADDDIFVNVPNLLAFLEARKNETWAIFGRLYDLGVPIRDPSHKWYIPEDEFSGNELPLYVSGPNYLLTADLVPSLRRTAMMTHFIRVSEDVFLTGVVAENIVPPARKINAPEFLHQLTSPPDICTYLENISVHHVKPEQQLELWVNTWTRPKRCGRYWPSQFTEYDEATNL